MRSVMLVVSFVGSLMFAMTGDLRAQTVPDSLVGHRVRLHLSHQERSGEPGVARQILHGVMTRIELDSIAMQIHPSATQVVVAVNGIQQIDVSRGLSGSRTALRRGAMGAALWGGVGAMGGQEFGGGVNENFLIWATGGFIFGAVLGALKPEEGWTTVFRR
jgi:hypothetical protein